MPRQEKLLLWLHGEIRTPPFSPAARLEVGFQLRRLQRGERLDLPHSRPMSVVGPRCHELRIRDRTVHWRILYRTDPDAILILEVFRKTTPTTPRRVIEICKARLHRYDASS